MAIHWVLAIQRSFPQSPLGKKNPSFTPRAGAASDAIRGNIFGGWLLLTLLLIAFGSGLTQPQ